MQITYKRIILDVSIMMYIDKIFTEEFDSKESLLKRHPDAIIIDTNN